MLITNTTKKEIEMCINSAIFPGFIFIYTSEMWNVDHHESLNNTNVIIIYLYWTWN